jgi:hypothetical protein
VDFDKWEKPLHVDELRKKSESRIPLTAEFKYVLEDLEIIRKRTQENRLSLNESERQRQLDEDKSRREKRDAERKMLAKEKEPRAYKITLDNVDKKGLAAITFVEPKPAKDSSTAIEDEDTPDASSEPQADKDGRTIFKAPPIRLDPVKHETLNILTDLVELTKSDSAQTAKRR